MFGIEIMFQIIGSLVIAFLIVFTIFLLVHGNPMRKLASGTHEHVSDIKKVVLDIHKNISNK